MKDKIDIIREVAFEIDKFELKHYNEEVRGCFERVQKDLDDVRDTVEDLADPRFVESERLKKLEVNQQHRLAQALKVILFLLLQTQEILMVY